MLQKISYRTYVSISVLLFVWILFAWYTGTFGQMFSNKMEALYTIFRLLILSVPPVLLRICQKKNPSRNLAMAILLLLSVELLFLVYFIFWELVVITLATYIILLLCLLIVHQVILMSKKIFGQVDVD